MATPVTFTRTLPPYSTDDPLRYVQWFELLPFDQAFDDCLDLLLRAKLFFSQINMTREQLAEILEQKRRTGLTLEHLAYRNGFCEFENALQIMQKHREIKRILEKGLAE